jgi:hypothetical protein
MDTVGSGGVTYFSIRIDGHSLSDYTAAITQRTVALAIRDCISGRFPGLCGRIRGDVRGTTTRSVLLGCVGSSWNSLVVFSRIVHTGKGVTKSSIAPFWDGWMASPHHPSKRQLLQNRVCVNRDRSALGGPSGSFHLAQLPSRKVNFRACPLLVPFASINGLGVWDR